MKPGYTIATDVLHPKSRGRISLNSRDINDQPKIEPNYFSHPDDVRTAVAGAQLALRIGLAPPFKKRGAKVFNTPSPRCKHLRLFSDAYWACIIRDVWRLVCMIGSSLNSSCSHIYDQHFGKKRDPYFHLISPPHQVCTIQHLPRRRHVPHGPSIRPTGSCGPRTASVPRGRPQGGRHFHHARDHIGEHSRTHYDDWGEMRRHDQTDLWVGRIQELRVKMVSSSDQAVMKF